MTQNDYGSPDCPVSGRRKSNADVIYVLYFMFLYRLKKKTYLMENVMDII